MRSLALAVGCLCGCLFPACRATGPDSGLESARIATANRNWPWAAELWHERWIQSGLRDGEAAHEAARAFEAHGDAASALGVLRARLDRAPDDVQALERAGELGHRLGQLEAARIDLERALELEPGRPAALLELVRVRRDLGDAAGARELATAARFRAIESGATESGADRASLAAVSLELARASASLGDGDAALDAWAVAFDGGAGTVEDALHAARVAIDGAAAQPDGAAAGDAEPGIPDGRPLLWLDWAEDQDPLRTEVPRAAARLALARGAAKRAAAAARRALEGDPGDFETLELLIEALLQSGDGAEAERMLAHGRALALDPDERRRLEGLEALARRRP